MSIFKRFRDHANWTQERLSEALGVQRTAVSNYENGQAPKVEVARRFVLVAREHGFPCTLDDVFHTSETSA